MIDRAAITVRSLRARAVRVPLPRPHPTASGTVSEAPLVLVDLLTDGGRGDAELGRGEREGAGAGGDLEGPYRIQRRQLFHGEPPQVFLMQA